MKKCRPAPVPLLADDDFDQTIKETCPGYAADFKDMGLADVALACKDGPMALASHTVKQRQAAARALYTFADRLNDKEDEYYLNRLADRILGYTSAEEG